MKLRSALFSLLLAGTILQLSCTQQRFPDVQNQPEDVKTIDETPVRIGRIADNEGQLAMDMSKLKKGFENELGEGALIEHVFIDHTENTGKYYVVATGSQEGKYKTIRAELVPDTANNLMLAHGAVAEICSAVYCDECEFAPDLGCGCKGATGKKRDGCLSSVTKGAYLYLKFK